MEVSPVTRDAITAVWPDVEDYIRLIVDRAEGEYDEGDLFSRCLDGKLTLLIAHDGWEVYGAILSQVIEYPQKSALNVFGIGGRELDQWIDPLISRLREGMENIQADCIKAYARPGLERKLLGRGFRVRTHEMVLK